MVIEKGSAVYTAKEQADRWVVRREGVGKTKMIYNVPKSICLTREALREYVRENGLFSGGDADE